MDAHKGQDSSHTKNARFLEEDGRPQGATQPHPHRPRPYYVRFVPHATVIVGTGDVVWMRWVAPCGRPSSL